MEPSAAERRRAFRRLPSVETFLRDATAAALVRSLGRERAARLSSSVLDDWRAEIRAGTLDADGVAERLERGELVRAVELARARAARRGVVPAVNATGVVLHTGLGRAPLHPAAVDAMQAAARGYCVLEVERDSGARNERDAYLGELLARATGAEDAIAVNNNAGAVLLVLATFAARRDAIVSRGELVEIGGSFRMPDVMRAAGARLVEVGTTNRTRAADYRAAFSRRSGLFLKVHPSNFRLSGFVEEVSAAELGALGRELGVTTAFDLGSGWLAPEPVAARGSGPSLADEPRVRDVVAAGVDVVTFSGDKLLGGPQAGLVVGRRDAVRALRQSPVYRALRLDKVALAGLEATLELVLAGRADELPARALLARGERELAAAAERIAAGLCAAGFDAAVERDASQVGSGSAPGVLLPTWSVRVRPGALDADGLAAALRRGEPAVFARIHEGAVALDPRTLLAGEEGLVVRAFERLAARDGGKAGGGPSSEGA